MNQTECSYAELAVTDTGYNIVRLIQIICGVTFSDIIRNDV
uniref:DDE Tnp4 domain-containing protein n=1 Tax=Meloidogyne hapla TaxID=6305 RepID=A0A1I8BP66_MELHA